MQSVTSMLVFILAFLFRHIIFIAILALMIIFSIKYFRKKNDNKNQCESCIYYQQYYETQNEK